MSERNSAWAYVPGDQHLTDKFLGSAIREDGKQADCPVCTSGKLRFYAKTYKLFPNFSERSMEWVWCPTCHSCASQGNFRFVPEYSFPDPFSNLSIKELAQMEVADDWFDRLDSLWDSGDLHTVVLPKVKRRNR